MKLFKFICLGFCILVSLPLVYFYPPAVYWLLLVSWLFLIYYLHWLSQKSFYVSLFLFLISGVLVVFNIKTVAEPFARLGLVLFSIGLIQALIHE